VVRRLNRVEYHNTIRDLMGIDFNSEAEFPADDSGYGFDNIGEALSISPLHLEKYLQAAGADRGHRRAQGRPRHPAPAPPRRRDFLRADGTPGPEMLNVKPRHARRPHVCNRAHGKITASLAEVQVHGLV